MENEYCIALISKAKYLNDLGCICVVCHGGDTVLPFSIGNSKIGPVFLGLIRQDVKFVTYSSSRSCKRDCNILNNNWSELGYFFPVPYYLLLSLVYEDLRYKCECKGV